MLTNRQLLILQVTVDDFIETAQPVGSRQLSKKEEVPFSPATIRNDMADLEDMGFLEKTHTSSGRVPSEKGYRYYVDNLLTPQLISKDEIKQIRSIFEERMVETEQIIRKSANILSELTNYTSIMLGLDVRKHRVKRLSIVPLTDDSAVAIIVTDSGHVENRVFSIPENFTASDIERMVNIINEHLVGVHLHELQSKLEIVTQSVLRQNSGRLNALVGSLNKAMTIEHEDKVYYGGKMQLLSQPEFNDVEKAKSIMYWMEHVNEFPGLFHLNKKGINISIGSENNQFGMDNCSIITASYDIGEEQSGSIAIIGPTRMDYRRVVSLLDVISGDLSRELSRILRGQHG
ncbi:MULTISPECIES: heat-inducible transcriptional repressor HrcA [Psychrobacillus]|uniref:Heat-inducible transcription repressor HrcA n=1 Tax=Psychrobacillus faecigallinarum TaxID=2762235 RepID=A0ABR8R7P6_9BACI|nr:MULTISPECIES: heat-inducible transcriptional repressor HrcA [Psychrobacillus]MBD7943824.1 heat-inducible transcriptional repressor HrcA [Psychrobacillus faecigallinarum]QEY19336.1 heat-inducible transcriptional repressor HrcA [Psychrobacillus sp. AK 1817]QGM29827.1 heat-inducible transcriptional repressor HrcA [Bacillus sp. N3536]